MIFIFLCNQVVACAISYKADVVYRMGDGKLGLLRHDEVDVIWKDYDPPLRSQFLALFHDYRLAYPLFDSHGASLGASIVPAMLPEEPLGGGHLPTENDLKALFFPERCRIQASVRLEFEYLPVALLPKLQVGFNDVSGSNIKFILVFHKFQYFKIVRLNAC